MTFLKSHLENLSPIIDVPVLPVNNSSLGIEFRAEHFSKGSNPVEKYACMKFPIPSHSIDIFLGRDIVVK
jgi:hypothetical protein